MTTARARAPEMTVWSPAELTSFLTAIEANRNEALFRLMAMTGMRRNEVLEQMLDNSYITPLEYREAASRKLGLKRGFRYVNRREPYFFDYVQEKLIERYGVGVARRGGLRIHTTINPALQDSAREAVNAYYADPAGPSSAIVAIDPTNGKIRAMASTGTYADSNFNLAAQGHRQPGSAFKTFVLVTALRQGVDPNSTTYTSKPLDLIVPEYGPWKVSTYDDSYGGTMSITQATLRSDNTVYAQLTLDVGPENVGRMAKKLGVKTPLKVDGAFVPSMGLGSIAVSPLDMASAYATLAAGGISCQPMTIRKVVLPNGKEDDSAGWGKRNITIAKRLGFDDDVREIARVRGHEIDMFGMGEVDQFPGVAVEMEWNNKDPFYDQDLNNFAALHREGAIAVGVIVTRGPRLQELIGPVIRSKQGGFKYGQSTTHWNKLIPRVNLGGGGECPLLLVGIDARLDVGDDEAANARSSSACSSVSPKCIRPPGSRPARPASSGPGRDGRRGSPTRRRGHAP